MPEFRKKPVVIEAFQFLGLDEATRQIETAGTTTADWLVEALDNSVPGQEGKIWALSGSKNIYIGTLEGVHAASPGDWIIRGIKGELYPCKPDIFEATYDPA